MARLSTVLFDIFFWVAAFCLSPLILCYFILAGIRSCIISLLRLWKCPDATVTIDPFDPDIENARGNWPESKKIRVTTPESKFTTPTVEEVLEVKRMFANLRFIKKEDKGGDKKKEDKGTVVTNGSPSSDPLLATIAAEKKPIQVPPEICDMILDLAGYWPCTKTVVSRLMLIGKQQPESPDSVWMDKERDWRGNTPGASKKSQPWRRTPSHVLDRTLEDQSKEIEPQGTGNGIYLRSFPLGGSIELVIPDQLKRKIPKPPPVALNAKERGGSNWNWQKMPKVLQRGLWNGTAGAAVELEKRNAETSAMGVVNGNSGSAISSARVAKKSSTTRQLSPTEARSWALEIDELYPNVRPDLASDKFEKKEKKRTKQQWRSFYTMQRFHQWVVPIYQYYCTIREEKFRMETAVHSTEDAPFQYKNVLEPRLVDNTVTQNGDKRKKSAKVRKIVWTIWSKEMADRTVNERRQHVNPDSSPDLTWFEMFVEEPVPKSATDTEVVWKKKYPKGKENILVQRDLGHRIRLGDPRMRIHRVVWDWNDWEETEPDDDNEVDEGHWRYQGIDFVDLHNVVPSPSHPFRHLNPKNYCNCPFGTKLFWGEGVPPSKTTPVSSRVKPNVESASDPSSSGYISSSSSGTSSTSSNSASSSSSSSSSDSSSANSSNNSLAGVVKSASPYIAPNTVLEERHKTGSLRKNRALGKLVRSLRMGDRLVLVARAGGGLGWNPVGHRWDVGVYRAEVEVYWAV